GACTGSGRMPTTGGHDARLHVTGPGTAVHLARPAARVLPGVDHAHGAEPGSGDPDAGDALLGAPGARRSVSARAVAGSDRATGLTIALAVLLFADGLAVGLIAVLFLPLWVGGIPVPVTVLVAALANLGLVMLAGRVTDRTPLIAAPLIGFLLVYLLAAADGPGGDAVLPADWRALLLLFVGLVPAGIWLANRALARSF